MSNWEPRSSSFFDGLLVGLTLAYRAVLETEGRQNSPPVLAIVKQLQELRRDIEQKMGCVSQAGARKYEQMLRDIDACVTAGGTQCSHEPWRRKAHPLESRVGVGAKQSAVRERKQSAEVE